MGIADRFVTNTPLYNTGDTCIVADQEEGTPSPSAKMLGHHLRGSSSSQDSASDSENTTSNKVHIMITASCTTY